MIRYKETNSVLFRAMAFVIACLFLFNDQTYALSPESRLTQKEFEEEYLIRAVLLSHSAVNRYIGGQINPHNEDHIDITALNEYRPDKIYVEIGRGLQEEREIAIVGIPGLLKNTGQLAHVGLGRKNRKPVIYIDSRYFNDEAVLKHDKDEIGRWEAIRGRKGLTYDGMRSWIRQYIAVSDPMEGFSSRQIARKIHDSSHNIDHIYSDTKKRYKNFVDTGKTADAAALLDLVNVYKAYSVYGADDNSADINIASAAAVYKNFEEALEVFKAGNMSWDRATIEIRKEFVFMLAKSLGRKPGALTTYDFMKCRVTEFNNKSLRSLLRKYMDHGKPSEKDALKALKEKLNIDDLGETPYKDFEEALEVFKADEISWDKATIEIRKEFVFMLAKSLGREPGALTTYDFVQRRIPEFNNKSLEGLLQRYMGHDKLSRKDALKDLKEKLNIDDLSEASYKNFEEALEVFKAGNISWKRATIEIQKEFVLILAKLLDREPGALTTSDFGKPILEFNGKQLWSLLENYMYRGKLSGKEALKALKEKLNIKDIPKARWQEKKRDWNRVSGIIRGFYGLDVTGESSILNWLRRNRLNKEADIALGREIRSGDSAARDSLAAAHEGVIKYYASRLHSKNPDIGEDEFSQEGLIAILRGAERFDPDRNTSFNTFISSRVVERRKVPGCIEGSMLGLIRDKRGSRRKSRIHQYTSLQGEKSYMDNITARDIARRVNLVPSRIPQIIKERKDILYKLGPVLEYLIAIRDDDKLMNNALNSQAGIPLKEKFVALKGLGIFVPVDGRIGYFRFADMMAGPDEDHTKTLINAISNELRKCPATAVREAVKMAVIHEINKRPAVLENKALWHIIEERVIPTPQRSTIVTRVNKAFRENKDAAEKIWIIEEGKSIEDAINEIRRENPYALIDIALSSEEHIDNVPDDKSLKMLVFKPQGDYIQLEGVIAALRALHSENALPALLRLYSVMAQESFNNPPDAVSDNPKEFARRIIFVLPRASSAPVNDIPKLNERLLKLLTAA